MKEAQKDAPESGEKDFEPMAHFDLDDSICSKLPPGFKKLSMTVCRISKSYV